MDSKVFGIFTLLGLAMGVTTDYLFYEASTTVFSYLSIGLFCLLFALAYDGKDASRLFASSLVAAFLLSFPFLGYRLEPHNMTPTPFLGFVVAYPLFVFVGHCFHYAFYRDKRWNIRYNTLFEAVWTTIPLLFVAGIFVGLAKMLLLLAATIFTTVGNDFLWNLYFNNNHFNYIADVTLFFIGLGIGQQNINIIYNLRFLLLRMMIFLFPVLAAISILYCLMYVVYVATGGVTDVDPLAVLVPLTILGIIFFNAYFQNGETEPYYNKMLDTSLRLYRFILFILTCIMVVLILRKFTLDHNRVIFLLCPFLFALSYAIGAYSPPDKEKTIIQQGNIVTALLFLLGLFFMNLPFP